MTGRDIPDRTGCIRVQLHTYQLGKGEWSICQMILLYDSSYRAGDVLYSEIEIIIWERTFYEEHSALYDMLYRQQISRGTDKRTA